MTNWHLARAAYERMIKQTPNTKHDFNVELVNELIQKQGGKDPRNGHKLDAMFATVVRKDIRGSFVWQNAMVVNGTGGLYGDA